MPRNAPALQESPLTFAGAPQPMNGFFVRPAGDGPVPGIVLLHDVYGLTGHVKDVARRLAREGYAVLAPDLYSRGDGPGWPPRRENISRMVGWPDERTIADVQGAVAALRSRTDVVAEKAGLMGFSFGARYSLFAAARADVAAAAIFYPVLIYPELTAARPCQPVRAAPELRCPCIVFFGDRDAMVPQAHVSFLRALLQGLGKPHEFSVYPGVDHGFMNDTIKTYRPDEAKDAWARTLRFFGRHLQGRTEAPRARAAPRRRTRTAGARVRRA